MKNDEQLVAEAIAGGPDEFCPIVSRYQDAVFGVAIARLGRFHDAEDVAQQVFTEAYQKLENLKDPGRLGAWLRSITIHRCIDAMRSRRPEVDLELAVNEPAPNSAPAADMERRELRDRVMEAIGRLSKTQRETTTLFYINGYSVEEVAGIQEVPVGTVKRRLHDARKKLKKEMMTMVEETLKSEAPKEDFSRRVFDLVNRYGRPALDKNEWRGIREDIWRIGIPGVQGFIKAMEMPHSPTRRVAVANAILAYNFAPSSEAEAKEAIVDLLKKATRDTNRKVRTWAGSNLLNLKVPERRLREEFLPLVLPLLEDRSSHVRWRIAYELGDRCPGHVPLELAARALATERGKARGMLEGLVLEIVRLREQGGKSVRKANHSGAESDK
jgi:RNA polymerase sigma-70 factor (ECF subfamily)